MRLEVEPGKGEEMRALGKGKKKGKSEQAGGGEVNTVQIGSTERAEVQVWRPRGKATLVLPTSSLIPGGHHHRPASLLGQHGYHHHI